jgi:hypothetical protein
MDRLMSEFTLSLGPRDQQWLDLRERFARAARELHFNAISNSAGNGAALLAISGNLARLAMSIPLPPTQGELDTLLQISTPRDA